MTDLDYRSLALAALFAALAEVEATATGRNTHNIQHFLAALFTGNAESLDEAFPDPSCYRPGVEAALSALDRQHSQRQIIGYAFGVVKLSNLLHRNPQAAASLGQRLDTLAGADFDTSLLRALEEVYMEVIGGLGKRLRIIGDREILTQPKSAARIRALLLTAIRFAWLWRQLGGRRWHLVFQRHRLTQGLETLKEQLA